MNTMHLVGAEDVRAAASNMRQAASEMSSAASYIDSSLQQHRQFLDDWLNRFEAIVDKLVEARK